MYRFALALTRSESDASDLVQQAFSTWAQTGRQLREGARAQTWLYTTLHRSYLEMRRRTTRLAGQPVEVGETGPPSVLPELAEAADRDSVMGALAKLDEDYRAPLVLFYLEQHSCHDIAEILDLPVKTVLQRLSRARMGLQRALKEAVSLPPSAVTPSSESPDSP